MVGRQMAEPIRLQTADGFSLAANHHVAQGRARGWVVINAAMGVEQGFYSGFAGWLAGRGFHALTYDYRGVAQSRPGPAERFGLRTWAEQDIEAALGWALKEGGPAMVVGHSLGTQLLGFAESAPKLAAVVGVASTSADWRNWPFPGNLGMFALSHLALPGVSRLFGRVPKGLMGEELPQQPILDWARWIRSKGYLLSEGEHVRELYARLTCPMTGVSIEDDRYAPKRAVDELFRLYSNAQVERLHLAPEEYGLKAIGHFGAFRRHGRERLWPLLARPLEQASQALARAS